MSENRKVNKNRREPYLDLPAAWHCAAQQAGPASWPRQSSPSSHQEDDGGGGLGWLAGPEAPGKVSLFYLCFLISVICFDLNKILNHFITLCQFLQELDILFQSSPTCGIIFGHILIYITNIFPMQIFMH